MEDVVALSKHTKKLSVLIVEDEKDANEMMTNIFKRLFGNVYSTFDGLQALKLYEQYEPDIVFADIKMPIMNGLKLSRKLKEINPLQVIVIISASNDVEQITESVDIGIDSFIRKPLDGDKLLVSLKKILSIIEKHKKAQNKILPISIPIDLYELIADTAKEESTSKRAIIIRALRAHFEHKI